MKTTWIWWCEAKFRTAIAIRGLGRLPGADNAIRGATSPDGSTMNVRRDPSQDAWTTVMERAQNSDLGPGEYLMTAMVVPVVAGDYEWTIATAIDASTTTAETGAGMGDKGGKKDKEKNKQQQVTKHKQEEQKKQDRAPAKKPSAGAA
jgi:hypothetical protein